MSDNRLKIGITQGDTNGIGWEVILKTLADSRIAELCTPVVYGSPAAAGYYRRCIADLEEIAFNTVSSARDARRGRVNLIACGPQELRIVPGEPSPEAGRAAVEALQVAVRDLKEGTLDALVTGPIDKETAQAELTTAQNDLREAQLVLEESTAKVAELEAQLVVLNDENEANKAQVETLTAELDTAKANQAAAQGYLDNVSAQLDELMQNLGLAQSALNGEATEESTAEPEATEEPAVEPVVTEEPAVEPVVTEEPAVEPAATEEPAVEPAVTEEPTAEPEATEEPTAEPEATEEPAAEGRGLTTTITSMLPDEYTLDVELHLDANNVVTELKLTLEDEIEGLTQEMLDAFAEQFVGKQLPVVLHADADETTAEEQIVEGMENQLENSRGIVEMLNKLAEQ